MNRLLACALALLALPGAAAADICPALTRVLADPPSGFVALRGAPDEPQYWHSKPFLAGASCTVWAGLAAAAHTVRCVANDEAAPARVTAFYETTRHEIDACLASLPDGAKYARQVRPIDTARIKGSETTWVLDTPASRLKIDLADFLRVAAATCYNSFSVEYVKY